MHSHIHPVGNQFRFKRGLELVRMQKERIDYSCDRFCFDVGKIQMPLTNNFNNKLKDI